MRCGLRAGWRDGSERLCQETDESQLVIVGGIFVRIRRKCASPKTITWSTHSRRIDPISLSAKPFCQGEPEAMGLSRMPMARNRRVTAAIDAIPITDQLARGLIPRECFSNLACDPFRGRIRCDIDPDKVSAAQPDDD